jgi:lipopolysaccharide export system protein LptA
MSAPTSSKAVRLAVVIAFLASGAPVHADTVHFTADTVTMKLAEGQQHALLTGHAVVQTQDIRITADQVELFGKDFIYAQCHGSVHVVDTKRGIDLTSQDLFYDRDQKIARIKGNAVMADLQNSIVAKGGFIEDRDNEQLTIIQIGVRIFKNDIECKAEFARYYRDRKMLELSGMPWVSKGTDTYVGARITIDLDTEEISAEGGVSGQVQDKGKSGQPAAAGSDAGASGGTPPAPQPAAPAAPAPASSGDTTNGQ